MKREKGYFAKVYAESKGWYMKEPDNGVLLPFILADGVYLVFKEYITPLNFKYDLKMYSKKILKALEALHKDFFASYNEEDVNCLIEEMDRFSEEIDADLKLLRISVSNHLREFPIEIRNNLASMTTLVHLSQCSRIMYRELYRYNNEEMDNKLLSGIVSNADCLFSAYTKRYARSKHKINLNEYHDVTIASQRLCDKIIAFMKTL